MVPLGLRPTGLQEAWPSAGADSAPAPQGLVVGWRVVDKLRGVKHEVFKESNVRSATPIGLVSSIGLDSWLVGASCAESVVRGGPWCLGLDCAVGTDLDANAEWLVTAKDVLVTGSDREDALATPLLDVVPGVVEQDIRGSDFIAACLSEYHSQTPHDPAQTRSAANGRGR